MFPRLDAMVDRAAVQAGIQVPPKDPLDEAEAQIKVARQVQSMLQARAAIARIEAEANE
jgi:hypothetical protein